MAKTLNTGSHQWGHNFTSIIVFAQGKEASPSEMVRKAPQPKPFFFSCFIDALLGVFPHVRQCIRISDSGGYINIATRARYLVSRCASSRKMNAVNA